MFVLEFYNVIYKDKNHYMTNLSFLMLNFKIFFFRWLKKKNTDLKKERQEEMQKARVHKLLARKSRKSQQLAKAIKQAQAFRYVDYYGYRY